MTWPLAKPNPRAVAWRVAVLAALCACSGCAQRVYRATSLPAQFQAPRVANAQTVDLSRLAVPAMSSDVVDAGDVIEVTLASGADDNITTFPVRVDDNGRAMIPLVGGVPVGGLELQDAEQAIKAAAVARGLYRDPYVAVTMKKQRSNMVTVLGAVMEPGEYELPRGRSSLLAALVAAGGLDENAAPDVEIRQPPTRRSRTEAHLAGVPTEMTAPDGTPVAQVAFRESTAPPTDARHSLRVNLVSAAQEGSGHVLTDGAVVMVHKSDPKPIHVMGRVKQPGQFDMPFNKELRALDAIALAGGVSVPWADRILVVRQTPDADEPVVITLRIRDAKFDKESNVRLASGDVVSVEESPATLIYDLLNFARLTVGGSVGLF